MEGVDEHAFPDSFHGPLSSTLKKLENNLLAYCLVLSDDLLTVFISFEGRFTY
jgi:hypothetical protein